MREAGSADVAYIRELFRLPHARQFLNDPGEALLSRLEEPDVEAYIVESAGSPEGYFDLRNCGWLSEFGSLIAQRPGRGAGAFVLEWGIRHAFESGAHRITLNVREDNDVARALCERLGFRQEGLLRDGFHDTATGGYKNLCVYGLLR